MKIIFVVEGHPQAFENRADAEELALALAEEYLWNDFNELMQIYPSIKGSLERVESDWKWLKCNKKRYIVSEYTLFENS
jgi:hypothetical protein